MRIEGAVMKTANPNEVRYCCSECGDEGFHLYYNIKKEVYHCFKCGLKGKQEPEKLYTDEKLEEIMDIISGKKKMEESEKVLVLPECHDAVYDGQAVQYMKRRGISEKKMRVMGCLVADDDDPVFDYRIILPIYNEVGKIIYYQARGLMNSIEPKYLNPIYPKKDALFYNMERRLRKQNYLFVVEGIFKALNLWRIDEPAVAILGKEITTEQIKKIWSLTDDVIMVYDPDALSFLTDGSEKMNLFKSKYQWSRAWYSEHDAIDDMSTTKLERWIHSHRRRESGAVL